MINDANIGLGSVRSSTNKAESWMDVVPLQKRQHVLVPLELLHDSMVNSKVC